MSYSVPGTKNFLVASTTAVPMSEPDAPFDGSTLSDLRDTLTRYFTASRENVTAVLTEVLENPPMAQTIVDFALRQPGIEIQDRAAELLGRLAPRALRFAIQFGTCEHFLRPVYANKVWEIVIAGLALADPTYASTSRRFISQFVSNDPNPIKRIAAIDAMETLAE